jgi:hypothetical protein
MAKTAITRKVSQGIELGPIMAGDELNEDVSEPWQKLINGDTASGSFAFRNGRDRFIASDFIELA